MINKLKLINIFLFLMFSHFCVEASPVTFKVEKFNISLNVPEGWQGLRGYLGRDITLLGLELGEKRDTIFIEVTDLKRLDLEAEKKSAKEFRKIKNAWLKKKAAILNDFSLSGPLPYMKEKYLFHKVTYVLNKLEFVEGNLFLECGSKAGLNVSFLTLKNKEMTFQKNLKEVLTSLKCL